ncbi:MAG: SLC13 family permease [Anaerolineae bacterium]|nr:SLC13 family permease [Anaerolineae bacterium]
MADQIIVFATLLGALFLFVTGFIRYDIVAMLALVVLTLLGIIPAEDAFLGFANPAVITVGAVLVLSRSLENAGVVDIIGRWVARVGSRPVLQVSALTGLVTCFSAFINNVGALALLMPVAIQLARRSKRSPSYLLMPMAFGSLLGGMTTLIGTPPNLIIADFRRQAMGEPFRMFDYSPVGVGVALVGVLFIVLIGWRLVPRRRGQASRESLFDISDYLSELIITNDSDLVGTAIKDIPFSHGEMLIVALIRGETRFSAPSKYMTLRADDILIVRAGSEAISDMVKNHNLRLSGDNDKVERSLSTQEISLVEAVVTRYARAEKRTARDLSLRDRYQTNLIALARRGQAFEGRLSDEQFRTGDVLLLQMPYEGRSDILSNLGLLPLAERDIKIGKPQRLILTLSIFTIAIVLSAFSIYPAAVAFSAAAIALILSNVIRIREAYASIDWSIIVLLGAMIPVGQALETTGGATRIAELLLQTTGDISPPIILGLVLLVTMFLSDVINNAAAAIVMAPVGIHLANGLGVSIDPFLLAIAIGASCAFLTPIGHQSNTLVMGPGGYYFSDYWRMGLLLELLILVVSVPLLCFFWPF